MASPSVGVEWWRPAGAVPDQAGRLAASVQVSPVPFAALMVFTFVLLLAPQGMVPALAFLRIALLAGVVAVTTYCWDRFQQRQPLVRPSLEIWTAAVLLAWALATLPPHDAWPAAGVGELVDLFLKALAIFWLLSSTVTTLGRLRTVMWAVSLMAAPLALTGIRHFFSHVEVAERIFGYPGGLTANANDLALTLNLILPLTVALFLTNRRPVVRGLLAGLIALDVGGIVVTFSRGGFLTLATVFALYLRTLQSQRRGWMWAVAALALAVGALQLFPAGYLDRLGTITNMNADQTGSAQLRWIYTQAALAYAPGHPLGAGLGMNILVLNYLHWPVWQPVHNVYLVYAVDLGWPGVGLFVLLLISCIRRAGGVRDRCAHIPALRELSVLAQAVQITLIAFAVGALFTPEAYQFYFYYFGGLALAATTVYEVEARAAAAPALRAA